MSKLSTRKQDIGEGNNEVFSMFPGSPNAGSSKRLQGPFRAFQEPLKAVSTYFGGILIGLRGFQRRFNSIMTFQERFKGFFKGRFKVFQGRLKGFSGAFEKVTGAV